jgi:hypothetical protein
VIASGGTHRAVAACVASRYPLVQKKRTSCRTMLVYQLPHNPAITGLVYQSKS